MRKNVLNDRHFVKQDRYGYHWYYFDSIPEDFERHFSSIDYCPDDAFSVTCIVSFEEKRFLFQAFLFKKKIEKGLEQIKWECVKKRYIFDYKEVTVHETIINGRPVYDCIAEFTISSTVKNLHRNKIFTRSETVLKKSGQKMNTLYKETEPITLESPMQIYMTYNKPDSIYYTPVSLCSGEDKEITMRIYRDGNIYDIQIEEI